jgi:hypothetical protein
VIGRISKAKPNQRERFPILPILMSRVPSLLYCFTLASQWCLAERVDPSNHWAYQPVKDVAVPTVQDALWPSSDLDRYFLSKMEEHDLRPAADAPPEVLCRRLYFTVTGLPPSPAEVKAFTAAVASSGMNVSLAKLVDQLLASTHYGEKWAQHWMDVVRYADGKGAEYDYPITGAWRYRDYLVRAFNADIPYDQFLREHLMGDLMPPRVVDQRNESLLATCWWNLGEAVNSPVDVANDEAERMESTIDTLGKAFQGLTLACARCHDHKVDPISTRDYYALYGMIAGSPTRRTWSNEPALKAAADALLASRVAYDASQPRPAPIPLPPLPAEDARRVTRWADFSEKLPVGWLVEGAAEIITVNDAISRSALPGLWSGHLSRKLPAWVRSPAFTVDHDFIDVLVTGEDCMIQVVIDNYLLIKNPLYGHLKQEIKSPGSWRWHRFSVGRWKGQRCVIEIHTGKTHSDFNLLDVTDTDKSQFGLRAVMLTDGAPWPQPKWEALPQIQRWPGAPDLEMKIPAPERFLGVSEDGGWDMAVMNRGDAAKPLPGKVPRQYLEYFPALRQHVQTGSGRRELTEAILSEKNPLTLRVYVNRLWQHVFGQAIVTTTDNFGHLGVAPSHPECLDFLTQQFRTKHHLQTKSILREMLLSRLWRQASSLPPSKDPDNTWMSVFPLRRLDAESIRDGILAITGDLDPALGGPPIPVPHRIDAEMKPPSGPMDGQRRRSIYLERRRNFPQRFLSIFDRPPSQATKGTRDVTNVPAQSLALLNDPFVLEQAQRWAQRQMKSPSSADERLAQMHFTALGRPANESELAGLRSLLGESSQEAAWTLVALSLFNQKEFLYVR